MYFAAGGNQRGRGDTILKTLNHWGKRRNVPIMLQILLQCSTFTSERPLVWTWGCQTSCSGRHLISLCPWL